jgi:Domain of unknown function (DUF222)
MGTTTSTTPAQSPAAPSAATLATMSTDEVRAEAKAAAVQAAAWSGRFALYYGELDRRDAWRADGAASGESWIVAETGASVPTARAQAHVAERLSDLPHLAETLCSGEVSFDKVRVLADVATPETDAELAQAARGRSVIELGELARATAREQGPKPANSPERRRVRFNAKTGTMTAQLPAVDFTTVQALVEARAKKIPSDGTTPWDERQGDAFMDIMAGASSGGRPLGGTKGVYLVVAHVPLEALIDQEGAESDLFAELERGGLISAGVTRRLACEGAVVVAVDDADGHTMYEGRATRDATPAQRREIMRRDRHCRFPGCTHVVFHQPHHIDEWGRDQGPTDLDNLVALCAYHHALVHSKGWSLSGDANVEITFAGPHGRVMTSRPSPLWTRVSTQPGRRLGEKQTRAGPPG